MNVKYVVKSLYLPHYASGELEPVEEFESIDAAFSEADKLNEECGDDDYSYIVEAVKK